MLLPGYRHLFPSVRHEGKVKDMCVHLTFISKAGFPMWHHRILNLNGKVSLAVKDLKRNYGTLVALWKGKSMVKPSIKTESSDDDEK